MKKWIYRRCYAYAHNGFPGSYFELGINYERGDVTLMLGFWSVGVFLRGSK